MHLSTRSKTKASKQVSSSSSHQPPHPTTNFSQPSSSLPPLTPLPKISRHEKPMDNQNIPNPNPNPQAPWCALRNFEEDRPVGNYVVPTLLGFQSPIRIPDIQANSWEVKPALINMVSNNPFTGHQNPNAHLASFLELCATFKLPNVPKEVVYLKLFPFSLVGKAKEWLYSHEPNTFGSWEELANAFLLEFFPPAKTKRIKEQIHSFSQQDGETFYEAYERFKELLRACPHHNLNRWDLLQSFYDGIFYEGKAQMDQASGGAIMELRADDGFKVIERIAKNSHLWGGERSSYSRDKGKNVHEVRSEEKSSSNAKALYDFDSLAKKVDSLASSFNAFSAFQANAQQKNSARICAICDSTRHDENYCPHKFPIEEVEVFEEVDYMGSNQAPNRA